MSVSLLLNHLYDIDGLAQNCGISTGATAVLHWVISIIVPVPEVTLRDTGKTHHYTNAIPGHNGLKFEQ